MYPATAADIYIYIESKDIWYQQPAAMEENEPGLC